MITWTWFGWWRSWISVIVLVLAGMAFTCTSSPANPNHAVSLAWQGNTGEFISFKIYRSLNATTFDPVATVTGLKWTDTNVLPNKTYWYYVTQIYIGAESGKSNVVAATIKP